MTSRLDKEEFLRPDFNAAELQIGETKLASSVLSIESLHLIELYVQDIECGHLGFKDGLDLLKTRCGWVHCAMGISFEIDNGKVIQIKLSPPYFQEGEITKKEIIDTFGKPDKVLIEDINYGTMFDYRVDANILVYHDRMINVFLKPKSNEMKELRIGRLDEKRYGKR